MTDLLGEISREEYIQRLRQAGVAPSAAEKEADRRYGSTTSIAAQQLAADAEEKAHRLEGNKIVRALGGFVVEFSQPRASKQTPGIPDTRYYFPRYALCFWWEWKSATGELSPAQTLFQEIALGCNDQCLAGDLEAFKRTLELFKLCTLNPDGSIEPIRTPDPAG